jgi:uncharacterized damage-inducible protein DinB
MKAYLARMFRYQAWAHGRTLQGLHATPAAQADALPLMAHLLGAEHIWLSRLNQQEPRYVAWPDLSLEECNQVAAENESGYRAFIEQIEEEQLARLVRYSTSRGQEFATPALDILTHVLAHGPYHRGQIGRIIVQNGGSAPSTDFFVFAHEVEPNT